MQNRRPFQITPSIFLVQIALQISLIIALAVFGGGVCKAVPSEFLIQRWDTSSGLPHNTVRAIAQTPNGYLWLGTENGLARFDGVQFENFDQGNTPVLQNPNVEFLQTDSNGLLWAGTLGHIYLWDGRRLTEQSKPMGAGDRVDQILISRTNEVILSTLQGCLLHGRQQPDGNWNWDNSPPVEPCMSEVDATGEIWQLRQGGKLWRNVGVNPQPVKIPASDGLMNVMVVDAEGRLWLGTDRQLLVREGNQFKVVPPPATNQEINVSDIYPTRDGALWVVAGQHLWKFSNGLWQFDAGPWSGHQQTLRPLLEDRAGSLWFNPYGHGLLRLDRDGQTLKLTARGGLTGDLVRMVFQDREGNLWVGIDRGGLLKLRPRLFQTIGSEGGLSEPVVLGVCEDASGSIWAATYGGGLNRWIKGALTTFNLGPDDSPGYLFTVFPDREGRLWVGTRDNGVFIREHGVFRHPFSTNDLPAAVRAIFQDRAGTIWLGSGEGVFRWRDSHLERFATDTELAKADVRGFAEDSTGALWIATHGDGLHRFQAGQHTVLHSSDGLPNEYVRSLLADNDGALWVGMYGGGLLRWKNGVLAPAASSKDLPDDVICHIEDDRTGHFWIGTHHGLFQVAKSDLNAFADGRQKSVFCIVYNKQDGLPGVEFSGGIQPSGWHAHDGRLWFATDNGLVSLQPTNVDINNQPPPVTIESLTVDSELFASSLDKGRTVHDLRHKLRIPAGRTQFEFRFTALSFTAPDNVRFQYRLENLEKNWIDAGMNRMATYNYLPPGDYEFHVRAANNDGVWNETGTSVTFVLLPHFWQRWWFRTTMVAMIIGLAWLEYKRRMVRLHELERLRLRIARDLHDDVGANLASMALIAEAMQKEPTFGDPADLRRIALQTIDSLRDVVWFIDPARDRLGDLVTRMRDTAPLLLTGLKYNFDIAMPNPDINLPPAFRRNVFPIFKETLHNASSHARASRVNITLNCRDGVLHLTVNDDGVGFEETKIIPGNGLRNLRRRAAEMQGAVRIKTAPGEGTTVEFEAPFPRMRGFNFRSERL